MEPYEIIMAPYEIYLAPVGESFPDVDETPAGNWAKLGTNGKYNLAEEGVTVTHEQTLSLHRTLGSVGAVKAARTEEGLLIACILEDLTAEQYAKVLNNVSVSDIAAGSGTPGHRDITLRQGPSVATFALLAKGPSPYGDNWNAQYQVPRVLQNGNPAPVFTKGEAAGLACEFVALEDANAATEAERFGKLVAQDADAV
jgi:hypothetical protein